MTDSPSQGLQADTWTVSVDHLVSGQPRTSLISRGNARRKSHPPTTGELIAQHNSAGLLRWSVQNSGEEHRYLTLEGELDISTKSEARKILDYCISGLGRGTLVVDLTDLDFIDTNGIHLLARAADAVRESNARLRLRVRSSGTVRRVIDLLGPGTGLDRILESGSP